MIALLTNSVSRSGKPLRAPMLGLTFIRSSAEAVVAYLKSLNASQGECRKDECLPTLAFAADGALLD